MPEGGGGGPGGEGGGLFPDPLRDPYPEIFEEKSPENSKKRDFWRVQKTPRILSLKKKIFLAVIDVFLAI